MHKYIRKILKHSMQYFLFFKFTKNTFFQAVKLVMPLKDFQRNKLFLKSSHFGCSLTPKRGCIQLKSFYSIFPKSFR